MSARQNEKMKLDHEQANFNLRHLKGLKQRSVAWRKWTSEAMPDLECLREVTIPDTQATRFWRMAGWEVVIKKAEMFAGRPVEKTHHHSQEYCP